MPTWIPARPFIDYLTGAFLIVAGVCFLLARKTRMAGTYLGAWIVLLVVIIYGPVLIGALADPSTAVKVEGLNYFADTLLFGGVILSLARAMTAILPPSAEFTESMRNSSHDPHTHVPTDGDAKAAAVDLDSTGSVSKSWESDLPALALAGVLHPCAADQSESQSGSAS